MTSPNGAPHRGISRFAPKGTAGATVNVRAMSSALSTTVSRTVSCTESLLRQYAGSLRTLDIHGTTVQYLPYWPRDRLGQIHLAAGYGTAVRYHPYGHRYGIGQVRMATCTCACKAAAN